MALDELYDELEELNELYDEPPCDELEEKINKLEAALLSALQRMGQLSPDDSVCLLPAYGVSLEHGLATFLAFGKALQAAAASSSSGYGATQLLPELDQRMEDGDDSDDPEQQTSPISLRLAAERLAAKQAGCDTEPGGTRPTTPPACGVKSPRSASPRVRGKKRAMYVVRDEDEEE